MKKILVVFVVILILGCTSSGLNNKIVSNAEGAWIQIQCGQNTWSYPMYIVNLETISMIERINDTDFNLIGIGSNYYEIKCFHKTKADQIFNLLKGKLGY